VLWYAGVEFIGTPVKGQVDQHSQSMSCSSSIPTATTSGTLFVSLPTLGPSSNNLPTPSVEPEPPAPISVEKQPLAMSTKSKPLSEPVLGDVTEKTIQSTKGTGATRVHPKATVTFEDTEEDEVDDEEDDEEEEEEDQEEEEEEEEEDGEEAEEVEEGGRLKKGSHKKAAAKRKSAATHRARKRSKVKSKSDGAPKHANGVGNAGKRKKTPVVDRISKASNTRAGKAQGSK
jgi:hypothetical protein